MIEALSILLKGGAIRAITGICFLGKYILTFSVTLLICKNPSLSDEKVKYISKMVSNDSKMNHI